MANDFSGKHVVVTGATGALGAAVVEALVAAGASCHLPIRSETPDRVGLADHERVHVAGPVQVTEEEPVAAFYAGLPSLWASVHVAGGFDMAPVLETGLERFESMFRHNAVSCFLCCREAVR